MHTKSEDAKYMNQNCTLSEEKPVPAESMPSLQSPQDFLTSQCPLKNRNPTLCIRLWIDAIILPVPQMYMDSMHWEVSNLFKTILDHHCKVLSQGFDMLTKFRISYGFNVLTKVSNLFEWHQHYKVFSHGFNVLRKFRICSKQYETTTIRYFHMDSMCWQTFESVRTTSTPTLLGTFTWIRCVEKVSNLFEWLVYHHY